VHDSDGLLLQTATGEWEWRPLINPEKTFHISHFPGDHIKGFGLLQRQRDFAYYQDLGARYDLRPDLWFAPRQSWGAGTLELVEIPTPNEWNDNIVAYWVPAEKASAGRQFHLAYSLSASLDDPPRNPLLSAHSTRIDPPQNGKPPRFFVDFIGRAPVVLAPDAALTARITPSRGDVRNLVIEPNDVTGGWRAFFDLVAPGTDSVQMRGTLNLGEKALSETWLYLWLP